MVALRERLYLVETTSGEAGRAIDGTNVSWDDVLNESGSGSITLKKRDLRDVEPRRLRPWWGSILVTVVDSSGVEYPKVAGPIVSPVSETTDSVTLKWSGIRSIFEHRYLDRDMSLGGTTAGQIAWELVREAMNRPGGLLPIVHETPFEESRFTFMVEGWNLANNNVEKLLTQITETRLGPDMMFRPRWVEGYEGSRIEWVFVHGTKLDPTIPQSWAPDWDTTAPKSDVADVSVSSNSASLVNRVRATGAGQGKDTARSDAVDNLKRVALGYPFLETVISVQDEKRPAVLTDAAWGHLQGSQTPRDQVTLKVHAGDDRNALYRWNVGDAAYVTLGDEWLSIPAGRRVMRILKASRSGDGTISVDMQEDSWGDE